VRLEFAKIKGAKIILHTKSSTFRAAKLKGFTVQVSDGSWLHRGWLCVIRWSTNNNNCVAPAYCRTEMYAVHVAYCVGNAPRYLAVHSWNGQHYDSIFLRLPAINWQFLYIGGSHPAVGRSLSLAHWHGTHCQNVYLTPPLALLFLAVFSEPFLRVLVYSAL